MNTTALAGAAVALTGALIARAFLPARSDVDDAGERGISEPAIEATAD